jgi:hypothetical protein
MSMFKIYTNLKFPLLFFKGGVSPATNLIMNQKFNSGDGVVQNSLGVPPIPAYLYL